MRWVVFFLFLVVIYLEVPGIPLFLCSVHSMMTWMRLPFFAMSFPKMDRKSSGYFYSWFVLGQKKMRNPIVF
jgi:hypothetical protein